MADAVFDPWAGKSIGVVSAPAGFDEFWAQHEGIQKGLKSDFLQAQETLVRDEDTRRSQASKGRGKGRSRYAPRDAPAPRARPTHFVAIRLYSRMIRRNVQQMQQWFIKKDPLFEKCVVPVRKLHSSLLLTSVPDERRDEARLACQEAGRAIREFLGDQPVKLTCSGVGTFNGQVLFTRLRTEPHEMLQSIHDALARSFMNHGFPVLDETAKAWLGEGEEPHDFRAHASFLKVSKAMAHASVHEKRSFRNLRVTVDDTAAWKDVFFGTQLCQEFELLDMVGSTRDGYYPCIQLEKFHEQAMGTDMLLNASLAAGPLRTCKLRVDAGRDEGAGMTLSHCEAGYLIEEVRPWPGQPELRQGDVIVAIGDEVLIDLDESELERRFGSTFEDGVRLVAGRQDEIQKHSKSALQKDVDRLLRPWQNYKPPGDQVPAMASRADGPDAGAFPARGGPPTADAMSVSMYTEGGTKLKGHRHQLRTSAPEFSPDPLSKPGGDPWAQAAVKGHAFPAYTGWGTKFVQRYAARIDSSHFLRPRMPLTAASAAAPESEADTKVHRNFQNELRNARSHEQVLAIVARGGVLLSLRNRSFALSRMLSCGHFLPDEVQDDLRLKNLLSEVLEDCEAVEESGAALPPATLSSLALALGKLGLRRPEIFRSLATLARRSGIWTFSDEELAALLEGFSRSRLSDEVLFQEAARFVVARLRHLTPRALATMLTAFACSSISTEHLFFAAGDHVLQSPKRFSLGVLAELADAFSRVRARHALLLEMVPAQLTPEILCDRTRCSMESLVKLFSAYVDVRQSFGHDGLRDDLARAICTRQAELSARLMRQTLQAAGRARWPHADLLDIAGTVAARDPKKFELVAMLDCFDQLRVVPPRTFPSMAESDRRQPRRDRKGADNSATAAHKASETDWIDMALPGDDLSDCEHVSKLLREGRLAVEREHGAGIGTVMCEAGYLIEEVAGKPAQPDVAMGDVVLAIDGVTLVGLDEDVMEQKFRDVLHDGASLLIGRLDDLQQVPLPAVAGAVQELLHPTSLSASPVVAEGTVEGQTSVPRVESGATASPAPSKGRSRRHGGPSKDASGEDTIQSNADTMTGASSAAPKGCGKRQKGVPSAVGDDTHAGADNAGAAKGRGKRHTEMPTKEANGNGLSHNGADSAGAVSKSTQSTSKGRGKRRKEASSKGVAAEQTSWTAVAAPPQAHGRSSNETRGKLEHADISSYYPQGSKKDWQSRTRVWRPKNT